MSEKNRLAIKICNATQKTNFACKEAKCVGKGLCAYCSVMADDLLANGVIVQKQGKWVSAPIKDKGYDSKTIPTCTNCGYQSFITYTYCPECGARVKGA